MDRNQELLDLQIQLEQAPSALEDTLSRAQTRLRRRNRRIYRGFSTLAASFALFVALVNFCMPVAYACAQLPGLRELAEAVTFSKSLTRAVDNEYMQPVALTQSENGITASVEYLIVDQKQLTVFFRLQSENGHTHLDAETRFSKEGTDNLGPHFWGGNDYYVEAGQLQSVTMEMSEEELPNPIDMKLQVYDPHAPLPSDGPAEPAPEGGLWEERRDQRNYLAEFLFTLSFDPVFVDQAKVYPLNETVEIDGQKLLLTQLDIYPTHLRVHTKNHPDNTALITGLEYEIRGDWDLVLESEKNGVSAFGTAEQETVVYRADSPWFCRSDKLELVITRATMEDKDMGLVQVDLQNGTVEGQLPEGVEFLSAEQQDGGVIVNFKAPRIKPNHSYQLFGWTYYDADGTEYTLHGMGSGGLLDGEEYETHFSESLYLRDYPYDQVWLKPNFSHYWNAETPVTVRVK